METIQLKILLKLLIKPNYQAKIGEIKPNTKASVTVTEKLCYRLYQDQLITIQEKNISIKITENGRKILNSDHQLDKLSVKILKKCQNQEIKTSATKINPVAKRDLAITKLLENKLIDVTSKKIINVQLTARGEKWLAEEFLSAEKNTITLTKNDFNNYLNFIRNYFSNKTPSNTLSKKILTNQNINTYDILETIIKLDQELNTDNYLPIFHLRNYYQSVLPREELDRMIFALQKENKISLSRLVDASPYSAEEYSAGIPQNIGYPIFYLIVNQTN